ncbi:hypothetical protein H7K45_09255 [Mycobacterium yunnanensis]|uniref:Uncharacterized protein n=1 Tax=Mycobacterium yunnanensis TaxID=368477 RepID=A0A9X2Z248_9MYCO|nr:hypothetical protein [Mycobacterium yunnanensis]MCV7420722.1 hypothetical protein [Mycobacterium yunnanensis]
MRRYKRGDRITTLSDIGGINVPDVPAGAVGTVVQTTLTGKPKTIHFDLETPWGHKRFDVGVHRRRVHLT